MTNDGKGRRKDGKPYKDHNLRDDGSYLVGKGRAPVATRFAEGDGRQRGKRAKGTKNFDTDWEEELKKPVTIKVNGERKKMSAHRAQVKVTLEAGSKGNIRAQQIIYDKASRIAASDARRISQSDDDIIEAWFAQRQAPGTSIVGDDATLQTDPEASASPAAPEEADDDQ